MTVAVFTSRDQVFECGMSAHDLERRRNKIGDNEFRKEYVKDNSILKAPRNS